METIGEYKNVNTKIKTRCKKHNYEWDALPSLLLKGCGCKYCSREKISDKRRFTHEEYIDKLIHINNNIFPIEQYKGMSVPIKHKCSKCDYEWIVTPASIVQDKMCPNCGGFVVSTESYKDRLKKINPFINVIDTYINSKTKIKHECKRDGYIWEALPDSILSGNGCPKCSNNQRYTPDEYRELIDEINPNIIILSDYINSTTKISVKCKMCNHEWDVLPSNIRVGRGCPMCNRSYGEQRIQRWLDKHLIKYEIEKGFNDCKDKNKLPFDFYLPEYNLLIEYDGEQHFAPLEIFGGKENFNITKKHDNIKNKYCEENNINLLRIPYYNSVEEILDNFYLFKQ